MTTSLSLHLHNDSEIKPGVTPSAGGNGAWVSVIMDRNDLTVYGSVDQLLEVGTLFVMAAQSLELERDERERQILEEEQEAFEREEAARNDLVEGNVWPRIRAEEEPSPADRYAAVCAVCEWDSNEVANADEAFEVLQAHGRVLHPQYVFPGGQLVPVVKS